MFSGPQTSSSSFFKLTSSSLKIVAGIAVFAAAAGCHTRTVREKIGAEPPPENRVTTSDKGQVLDTKTPASAPAVQDMQDIVTAQLQSAYQSQFEKNIDSNAGLTPEQRTELVTRLSGAAAREHVARLTQKSQTSCVLGSVPTGQTHACIVTEIFQKSFSSSAGIKALLTADIVLHVQNAAQLEQVLASVDSLHSSVLESLAALGTQVAQIDALVAKMVAGLEKYSKELELLSNRVARVDMPFLAKSFFDNKKFLLTTSFQQGSIGTERVLNLDTVIAKLVVNSGRLVLLQDKGGLYSGASAEDVVLGSYPIVASTSTTDGETFYQVDFSRPENMRFLRNAIASAEEDVNITAQVVVPSVFHTPKSVHAELGTGLFFTGTDKRFVLDQLVLLEGDKAIVEPTDDDARVVVKDLLHPTFHMVQGLQLLSDQNEEFEKSQSQTLDGARDKLTASGAKDLTNGSDEPFFTTNPSFQDEPARLVKKIQKFDRSKDLIFVLSENTPKAAIPVLKSAVRSYSELFEKSNAPEGQRAQIVAYSNEEFEKYAKDNGLDYGVHNIAADPRINMISWDSDANLGAAWATALTHPHTGEILSADIMLSGNLWSRVGCMTYEKTMWARSLKKGMAPSELVPSDAQRQTWSRMCDIALLKLGMADLPMPMIGRVLAPVEAGQDGATLQGSEADLERAPRYQTLLNTLANFDAQKFLKTSSRALQGNSESIVVSNGKNSLRMKPECARQIGIADIENEADVAGSGIPDFNSEFVANPEQAALAELRSVAVHELGHLFGMRHNFVASTTPGSVKDSSVLPVSISTRTDSVMDYNDYAIDLGMGAMRDYSSPDGAVGKANFGIYDVLALNAIYGLELKLPELASQTAFCTDRNVLPYGDCQRDDYGKNHIEYLMHQINLDIGRMKIEGLPLDSSGGMSLKTRLSTNITALALEWYIAQDQLSQKFLKEPDRVAALAAVNNTFFAKDVKSTSVVKWQDTYGMPVLGLLDLLKIDESGFKNPQDFLRKYDALIVRKTANESFGKFVQVLNQVRASKAGDMRYASMIRDFKMASGENFPFRTLLLDHFSASVVAPANSALPFTYFDDGTLKSGTEAKLNGNPVVVTSTKPFFNHNKNTLASKIQIDGGENGAPKDAVAITMGLYTVQDLKLLASIVALLDPYAVDNAPLNRITADRHALNCFSGAEVCADIPAIVPEKDKATSVIGARVLSHMYGELISFLQNPEATLADAAGASGN